MSKKSQDFRAEAAMCRFRAQQYPARSEMRDNFLILATHWEHLAHEAELIEASRPSQKPR